MHNYKLVRNFMLLFTSIGVFFVLLGILEKLQIIDINSAADLILKAF